MRNSFAWLLVYYIVFPSRFKAGLQCLATPSLFTSELRKEH